MQSFKEYLKEDDGIVDNSYFTIKFSLTNNNVENSELMLKPATSKDWLEEQIQKKFPEVFTYLEDVDYLQSIKMIVFVIFIKKQTADKLEIFTKQLQEIAEEFFNTKDNIVIDNYATLYNIDEQDFLVKSHLIKLSLNKYKGNSLKGISKKIECNQLQLWNIEQVDEGGLGLLTIKGLNRISQQNGITPQWYKIIYKYFANNDKDILECQEELISNGLKQYAKL